MIATVIGVSRLIAAAVAIFFAIYRLPDVAAAVQATNVGIVVYFGLVSFFSHVVFWRADAERLGVDTSGYPFFQWEVGFGNLAFGVTGLFAYLLEWGVLAEAVVMLGYGIYLAQAALLITYKVLRNTPVNLGKLFLSAGAALLIAGYLLYFAHLGILHG